MSVSFDSSFSWSFSDNGLGTSIENDTSTEFSCADSFENEVCDLHVLRNQLLEQDDKREEILKQIQNYKKFDEERLNAEKALLASTLKSTLLLNEFKEQIVSTGNRFCNIGSITLSNIKLHYSTRTCLLNKFRPYFLCVLSRGSSLFMSQIFEGNSGGMVNFNINHTFTDLPPDFKISVKVYGLKIKKNTWGRKLKKKISKWLKHTDNNQNEINWRRQSLFGLWKEQEITISNVNKTSEIILEVVNSELCKIVVDVAAKADTSTFSHCAWLDISQNGMFWNQRWCQLDGTLLKCFSNPPDYYHSIPTMIMDLKNCVSLRASGLYEGRSRVFILEFAECPYFFYISTNSNQEFKQWKVLEKLVLTLHRWKEVNAKIS